MFSNQINLPKKLNLSHPKVQLKIPNFKPTKAFIHQQQI